MLCYISNYSNYIITYICSRKFPTKLEVATWGGTAWVSGTQCAGCFCSLHSCRLASVASYSLPSAAFTCSSVIGKKTITRVSASKSVRLNRSAFSVHIIVKYVINALQLLELFLRPFTFSNLILPLSLLFTCFLSFRLFEGSRSEGRGSQRTLWYVRRAQVAVVDGNKSNIPVPDTFPDHQDPLENQGRPTLVWGEG